MKKVKGAALLHFAKAIKSDKSGVFDKYLKEEDRAILNKEVQPTLWYPYETFRRCFNAVFEVIAKKDMEKVMEWGRQYGQVILSDVYKVTIKQDNPLEHFKRIPIYIKGFYDFGTTETKIEAPNRVLLTLNDYDPDFAPLYYFNVGWFRKAAELCGAKNVQCQMTAKSWEDKSSKTCYVVSWD